MLPPKSGCTGSRSFSKNAVRKSPSSDENFLFSACGSVILTPCLVSVAMCIYVIYKRLKSETLISSKIWASQAENSQAKPPTWEAVQSVPKSCGA
jgi:hypothetical protein